MKNKIKKKLKKIHHEFNVTPLTLSLNFPGYHSKEIAELIGIKEPIRGFCSFKGFYFSFFTDEERWAEISKLIVERVEKEYEFFLKLVRKSDKLKGEIIKEIQEITEEKIGTLNNKRIASLLKKLTGNSFRLSVYSSLGSIADHHHNIFTNKLESITTPEMVSVLSTPHWNYPSDQAKKEKSLDNYLAKWYWLGHGHLGPGLSKKELVKEFNKSKDKLVKTNLKKKQEALIKKLSLKKREQNIFKIAQIFVYLRGMRAEICNGVYAILNQVAERVSSETKIKKGYLMFCSIGEVINYFRAKSLPSIYELKKRRECSVWLGGDVFKIKILSGQKAKEYIKEHTISNSESGLEQKEISGKVAFPGKVKGIVKIVNTQKEMKKIKPGDILISIQTTPELLPAMKKAAALITDIGGITSHAAIVSRELKKPCVVGARIATKIFRDGQLVEVDANKGTIKILKK